LVSLAPNITEIVYALGLGNELVGDTDYCDYPPAAKNKPHVGTMLSPSLEKIIALKPDLALGTPEANRRETADQLERLGIPLYGVTATTLAGTLASIEDLGRILGRAAEARSLVAQMQARIDRIEKRIEGQPKSKVLFVVWYRPLITVGPNTFIADVIRAAGGIPIGEDLKGEWPRLTVEELLPQNPAVILLPKTGAFSPSMEELQSLPGWRDLRAVKERRMYFVSEAIERPGPRLVDALEELANTLHPGRGPKVRALECGSAATAFPLPGPPMFPNKGGRLATAFPNEGGRFAAALHKGSSAATAFPLPGPPMFPNKGGRFAAALQGELRSRISNDPVILLNRGGSQ
jgi:iron complex transport system substrate-binding protein